MKPVTETLLVVAAIVALLWFGWNLAERTVIGLVIAQNQVQQLTQKLTTCEAGKR